MYDTVMSCKAVLCRPPKSKCLDLWSLSLFYCSYVSIFVKSTRWCNGFLKVYKSHFCPSWIINIALFCSIRKLAWWESYVVRTAMNFHVIYILPQRTCDAKNVWKINILIVGSGDWGPNTCINKNMSNLSGQKKFIHHHHESIAVVVMPLMHCSGKTTRKASDKSTTTW